MARIGNSLIGIAGVHHVVSELSRRGVIALPTIKNTAAYDIVAVNLEGTRHASIQVKASYKRVSAFLMPSPEHIRTGKHDFFVLARWLDREAKYQCFLLTGTQARAEARRSVDAQKKRIRARTRKGLRPSANAGPLNAPAASSWERAWIKWHLYAFGPRADA